MDSRPWFKRKAFIVAIASLSLWTVWNATRDQCHPFADLSCGAYTDHFSHVSLARLFVRSGFDIYKQPRGSLAVAPTEAQQEAIPDDLQGYTDTVFVVPGWPLDKPLATTWAHIPSYYPPGDLVLFAPISVLYSFTDMSFTLMNRLSIQLLLIYAHLTLYLIFTVLLELDRLPWGGIISLAFAYGVVIHWTLEGFYDGAWIAPLILTPYLLARRKPLAAVFTVSLALFTHFRAAFYAPWALYGCYLIFRDREWRKWTTRQDVVTAVTILLGLTALTVFWILLPSLQQIQVTNNLNPRSSDFDVSRTVVLGLFVGVIAVAFAFYRAWGDLAQVAWLCVIIVLLPETRSWDAIGLVPWLVSPSSLSTRELAPRVRELRITAVFVLAVLALHEEIVPTWLQTAIERLF